MIRRNFLLSILAVPAAILSLNKSNELISDFSYCHVDKPFRSKNGKIFQRGDCIPYFNGKCIRGVQEANSEEGWLVRLTGKGNEKIYGDVKLMIATPERRKEFDLTPTILLV